MLKIYKSHLKKYFQINGREPKKNAIIVLSVNIIILILFFILQKFVHEVFGKVFIFLLIMTFIPAITLQIRRYHDTGKSAWWMLLFFIPIPLIPQLIHIFFMCIKKGDEGPNKYGYPKNTHENTETLFMDDIEIAEDDDFENNDELLI